MLLKSYLSLQRLGQFSDLVDESVGVGLDDRLELFAIFSIHNLVELSAKIIQECGSLFRQFFELVWWLFAFEFSCRSLKIFKYHSKIHIKSIKMQINLGKRKQ